MNKVFKSNLYFLIIMLISIFVPSLILAPIYSVLGITNPLLILALNHITIFLIPAIIYTIITKSNPYCIYVSANYDSMFFYKFIIL